MRDARGGAISLQSRLQEAHRALLVSANNLLLYHWYGFIPYFTWWFLSCVQAPRAIDGFFIESHGTIFLNYLSLYTKPPRVVLRFSKAECIRFGRWKLPANSPSATPAARGRAPDYCRHPRSWSCHRCAVAGASCCSNGVSNPRHANGGCRWRSSGPYGSLVRVRVGVGVGVRVRVKVRVRVRVELRHLTRALDRLAQGRGVAARLWRQLGLGLGL